MEEEDRERRKKNLLKQLKKLKRDLTAMQINARRSERYDQLNRKVMIMSLNQMLPHIEIPQYLVLREEEGGEEKEGMKNVKWTRLSDLRDKKVYRCVIDKKRNRVIMEEVEWEDE